MFNQVTSVIFVLICTLMSTSAWSEEWITEEVLKQLSEVRTELKTLQQEVKALRGDIKSRPVNVAKAEKLKSLVIKGSPTIGDSNAQVVIVEFSDYQCPYCKRHFTQTFSEIEKQYVDTGKIQYAMKQYPLGFHAKARGASTAALCGERLKSGSYFDFHSSIFNGTTALNQSAYLALAKDLGLSQSKFESCLNDPAISKIIDTDMQQGESVGVSGTPAFLIGKIKDGKLVDGRLISGARSFSSFASTIDSLL